MKIKVKLIGMDLDGTLLTAQKELSAYTEKILRRAVGEGITVLPATGRPYSGVPEELKEFPGIRYAVTANGGRIVEIKTGKPLYESLVPCETARKVLEVFEHYDSLREIYYEGIGYAQEDALRSVSRYLDSPPMAGYILKTRVPVPDVRARFEAENRSVDKVQGLFVTVEDRDAAIEELKAVEGIEVTGALDRNIEVNAAGVDKGKALVWLGGLLGIRREEIMACGDGCNDLKMLKVAGIGVAMGNAREEVKAAADYIAASNDEDGVARFIEEYVLD